MRYLSTVFLKLSRCPTLSSLQDAFGGHLFALVVNAALAEARRRNLPRFPHPALFSTSILKPGFPGPCDIILSLLRAGGRFAVFNYALAQNGEHVLVGNITLTDISKSQGSTDLSRAPPPELPPREECPSYSLGGPNPNYLLLEPGAPKGIREWHPERVTRMPKQFWVTRPNENDDPTSWENVIWWSDMVGGAVMGEWGFKRGTWAATVEAQVQFLSVPKKEDGRWFRVSCVSKYLVQGRMDFEIEVWNEQGTTLLAVMRQANVLMSPIGSKPKI